MLIQRMDAQLFVNETCILGEGPFWFENRLWWVDIDAGRIYSVDAEGGDRKFLSVDRRIGAAVPVAGGHQFIVALEGGIGILDRQTGVVEILANPESGVPGSRFNDGKCDPVGRFLAGTLNMDGKEKISALYILDAGVLRGIFSPVSVSNGLAWSADGQTLFYIDSLTHEIAEFSYDVATGSLGERQVAVTIPPKMGLPDGMDIDREGNLWVCHWGGSAVRCWSPIDGKCLAEIQVPCKRPTSCCFGGVNLDQLFITSARTGGSEIEETTHPLSGSVFVCEPGVGGFPLRTYSAA